MARNTPPSVGDTPPGVGTRYARVIRASSSFFLCRAPAAASASCALGVRAHWVCERYYQRLMRTRTSRVPRRLRLPSTAAAWAASSGYQTELVHHVCSSHLVQFPVTTSLTGVALAGRTSGAGWAGARDRRVMVRR